MTQLPTDQYVYRVHGWKAEVTNRENAIISPNHCEARAAANQSSKERLSYRLLNIAGDLSEIAANPPNEMDSQAMARIASQLIALAGQVRLGEDIDPTRMQYDKLGWLCSVCGAWNHPGNLLCEHHRAAEKTSTGQGDAYKPELDRAKATSEQTERSSPAAQSPSDDENARRMP